MYQLIIIKAPAKAKRLKARTAKPKIFCGTGLGFGLYFLLCYVKFK